MNRVRIDEFTTAAFTMQLYELMQEYFDEPAEGITSLCVSLAMISESLIREHNNGKSKKDVRERVIEKIREIWEQIDSGKRVGIAITREPERRVM